MEAINGSVFSGVSTWPLSRWLATTAVLAVSTLAFALANLLLQRPKLPKNAPILIKGWPIFGSIDFYLRRNDFLKRERKRHGGQPFSFYYGRYPIVSLVGEAGRTFLYTSRQFDLRAGFSTLLAASPSADTNIDNPVENQITLFKKILTRERLIDALPKMAEDTDAAISMLSFSDRPVLIFPLMYRLIYRLTHRTGGVHEIAEDEKLLDSTLKNFAKIEYCSPLQIMFPNWPLPSLLLKLWAGFSLHQTIVGAMSERRRTGRSEVDALQYLMDLGEPDLEIVKCIIGILFSGLLNTGATSAWILCYLAENHEWYCKVQTEVDHFISQHRMTPDESILDILQRVSYHDWDTQLPTLYLCLRETLRLNLSGPALRKNLSDEDLIIPGTNSVVPKKAFVFYSMDEVHLDEGIYPNPLSWDPARHLPGREEGSANPHAFVGWGSGLHPCIGLKFATLEIFVAVVTMFAHHDFSLVEQDGRSRNRPLPQLNRNDLSVSLPTDKIYLKCISRSNLGEKR
ncbi:hypothetical protein NLG97_g5236 [Lecanicillium saksenae]|uniref:Uncharacterized protein n=1 Tax=Lecanicillium saksenae TaxID=468837 RepID=A0ACC1QT02_9HYPO|nr:hypothetical protein NLG97_g5236 [Lecanicillium saksenae]